MKLIEYVGSLAHIPFELQVRAVEVGMIRWTDLIGVAGSAMVILSSVLLFPDSAERVNWKYWLGGITLWFVGFASVVVWLLLRWSVRYSKDGPPPLLVWSLRQSPKGEGTPEVNESHLRNERTA